MLIEQIIEFEMKGPKSPGHMGGLGLPNVALPSPWIVVHKILKLAIFMTKQKSPRQIFE